MSVAVAPRNQVDSANSAGTSPWLAKTVAGPRDAVAAAVAPRVDDL